MKVLIGCEFSCAVRDAFALRGHDAWSCDFKPCASGGKHYQCDVLDVLGLGWDLAIFHPPCTYLCSSGLHWNGRVEGRQRKTDEALAFVRTLLECNIPRIALENPVGCIGTKIRKPNQIVQPYQFGEDASKETCLWLKGLPFLKPTKLIGHQYGCGKCRVRWDDTSVASCPICDSKGRKVWGNQSCGGQNSHSIPQMPQSDARSVTTFGIAAAMAEQWGEV